MSWPRKKEKGMQKENVLVVTPGTYAGKKDFQTLAKDAGLEVLHERNPGALAEPERVVALLLGHEILTVDALARMVNLKTIARNGSGSNNVPLTYARARGITVTTLDLGTELVSEYALSLVLALGRRVVLGHHFLAGGDADANRPWDARPVGVGLPEATCGIVGLGAIGVSIAKRLQQNGAGAILGWNRTSREGARLLEREGVLKLCSFEEVLRKSDFILVALALTPETRGMLSREKLSLLREGAYLVNICRGALVDEDALADRVEAGKMGGVALDVFSAEPPYHRSAFMRLARCAKQGYNVILTPHIASKSKEASDRRAMASLRNVIGALSREPLAKA